MYSSQSVDAVYVTQCVCTDYETFNTLSYNYDYVLSNVGEDPQKDHNWSHYVGDIENPFKVNEITNLWLKPGKLDSLIKECISSGMDYWNGGLAANH